MVKVHRESMESGSSTFWILNEQCEVFFFPQPCRITFCQSNSAVENDIVAQCEFDLENAVCEKPPRQTLAFRITGGKRRDAACWGSGHLPQSLWLSINLTGEAAEGRSGGGWGQSVIVSQRQAERHIVILHFHVSLRCLADDPTLFKGKKRLKPTSCTHHVTSCLPP